MTSTMRVRLPGLSLTPITTSTASSAMVPTPPLTTPVALGINDLGQVVGTYHTLGVIHGFLYSAGFFTTIDDPFTGVVGPVTAPSDINNAGQIVGYYGDDGSKHGFLAKLGPNPAPPGGTTADTILRASLAVSQYEVYDIGSNSILAAYSLGQVGNDWTFVGLGGFFGSDTTDMLLRNSSTGGFEVYDIANNNITGAAFLGNVGMELQGMGV